MDSGTGSRGKGQTGSAIAIKEKITGSGMSVRDLADLAVLLYMLDFYYNTGGSAAMVKDAVCEELSRILGCKMSLGQLYKLRKNARNAGAPAKYGEKEQMEIRHLRSAGHTIRSIASELGIPYSTVQRLLAK